MTRARRVLVVDDEPGIGPLVSMCLEPIGVDVDLAANLEEARRVARDGKVGLILLDIALGDEDGILILPSLRSEPALEGVPVVAFSAHDSRRQEAIESGVDSFISRPFVSADLQEAVRRYLLA